jgi:hypothetical protein
MPVFDYLKEFHCLYLLTTRGSAIGCYILM